MKKALISFGLFTGIDVVVLTIVFVFFKFSNNFINESDREIGKFVSPSGDYTVIAYQTNGGATTLFGVVCKLHHNNKKFHFDKKIYAEYPCDYVNIVWIDDDTVEINGNIIENVLKDKSLIYHTKPVAIG